MTTPHGYCKCGCGVLTTVPKHSDASNGRTAGVPVDFKRGHSSRGLPLTFDRAGDVSTFTLPTGARVTISREDEDEVARYTWTEDRRSDTLAYARGRYRTQSGAAKYVYLHRLIAGTAGVEVDHRDGNGLNNHRANLRPATRTQQMQNRKADTNGVSEYTGVYLYVDRRGRGKNGANHSYWVARVHSGGKRVHQSYHKVEEEAARTYDREAVRHFGEFARPNFPTE